jgi:hypothetical protein
MDNKFVSDHRKDKKYKPTSLLEEKCLKENISIFNISTNDRCVFDHSLETHRNDECVCEENDKNKIKDK